MELRVAGFLQDYEHTPSDERLRAVLAQQEVEGLLDGAQPLDQRPGLYRIGGQLSELLGASSFELSDYPTAHAQLLTAWQLAREVGDHALIARVRVSQSTVARAYARMGERTHVFDALQRADWAMPS